jgi:hypothetical protein
VGALLDTLYTSRQATYELWRLRRRALIARRPHTQGHDLATQDSCGHVLGIVGSAIVDGRSTPAIAALFGRTVAAIQQMVREIAEDLLEAMTPDDATIATVLVYENPERFLASEDAERVALRSELGVDDDRRVLDFAAGIAYVTARMLLSRPR